jgi:hypothetical protein
MKSLLLFLALVLVHDKSRPDLDEWFKGLQSEKGMCCSYVDGQTVEDADWESHDGHYLVRLPREKNGGEMIWVEVPDEAVIKEPNLYGRTVVWPLYNRGINHPFIRCFIVGTMI